MRSIAIALVCVACGTDAEPPPPPPPLPPIAAPASAVLSATNGTVFRWSDGDWIVRVTIIAENRGSSAVAVARRDFVTVPPLSPWALSSTFPDTALIEPGQRATGDIAWFARRTDRSPTGVTVHNASWSTNVELEPAPLPPPPGTSAREIRGAVRAQFTGSALTWPHEDDGSHIVRAPVEIVNGTNVSLSIPLEYFGADVDGNRGALWLDDSTFADPLVLAAGERASGFVAWYWSSTLPAISRAALRFGPAEQPLASSTVDVTASQPP